MHVSTEKLARLLLLVAGFGFSLSECAALSNDCSDVNAHELTATWAAVDGAKLYEIHFGEKGSEAFGSQTSATNNALVQGLKLQAQRQGLPH